MAVGFGVSVILEGARRTAAEYEAMAARADDLNAPLTRLGFWHVRKAKRILASGERGIQSRTRGLERSLTFAFFSRNDMGVGSHKIYAGAQQSGPRGGFYESSRPDGMLAIPIADNLRARQQAKFNSPLDVPDGFFVRTARYLLFVRRRQRKAPVVRGKRSRFHRSMSAQVARYRDMLEVLFLLVRRVPGRAHRYVTHDPADQAKWEQYARDWIVRGRAVNHG